jgi:hypothetical protein
MSDLKDITVKSVGFADQEGYPWYQVSVTLSRTPDKIWEDCFDEVFRQRMERVTNQLRQFAYSKREEIPDNASRVLEALGLEEDKELSDDTISSIEPLYELHGDVLTFRRVYGRDSKDGMEVVQKCLPDVKEWLDVTNKRRKESKS